ncbi:hypothetical protein EVAR_102394_1 [Eumeta japonica]|uniref:Uncharacterized protein n=1 Tax=Eumeta variegata TaxID=151549 RepID=A0A4C1YMT2_EUMVA|nr:hypothetical protein EVAR_102394_1 [Eumeta japonica]
MGRTKYLRIIIASDKENKALSTRASPPLAGTPRVTHRGSRLESRGAPSLPHESALRVDVWIDASSAAAERGYC